MPSAKHRITQAQDYRRVMRHGRRVGGQFLVIHAAFMSPDEPIRFGYVVSKKVGNAVMRNLITRRLKGISDEIVQRGDTGVDLVFRALPAAAHATHAQLRDEVMHQVRRHLSERA